MRITIDIDENTLHKVQLVTGVNKKSPAINQALKSYLRKMEKQKFIDKVMEGKCDYSLTNDELEKKGSYDSY